MPRRRRALKARRVDVTPSQRRWFLNAFAQLDGPESACALDGERLFRDERHARELWDLYGAEWTAEFDRAHRGRRPPAWQRFGAPRGALVSGRIREGEA